MNYYITPTVYCSTSSANTLKPGFCCPKDYTKRNESCLTIPQMNQTCTDSSDSVNSNFMKYQTCVDVKNVCGSRVLQLDYNMAI